MLSEHFRNSTQVIEMEKPIMKPTLTSINHPRLWDNIPVLDIGWLLRSRMTATLNVISGDCWFCSFQRLGAKVCRHHDHGGIWRQGRGLWSSGSTVNGWIFPTTVTDLAIFTIAMSMWSIVIPPSYGRNSSALCFSWRLTIHAIGLVELLTIGLLTHRKSLQTWTWHHHRLDLFAL